MKWVWYATDLPERPTGKEHKVKERRFVGPSGKNVGVGVRRRTVKERV